MSNKKDNQSSKPNNPSAKGIDFVQLGQLFRRFWYVCFIFPLVMATLAWVYLRYQIPVYEVKSTIIIKDDKNRQGISGTDIISKEFELVGNKKMLIDESKIMTSYSVIEEVVRDLKLDRTVSLRGTITDEELYDADAPIMVDSFSLKDSLKDFVASLDIIDDNAFEISYKGGPKQLGHFGIDFTNEKGSFRISKTKNPKYADKKAFTIICKGTEKAARGIINTISVVLPKKESNILEPTMRSTLPQKAKDILQNMVVVYNEHNLSDKKEVSQNTLQFIGQRLQSLTSELSGVEQNVEKYKTREGITADGSSDIGYFFDRLGEYDGELVRLGVQNSLLAGIEAILTKSDVSFELLPTNLELKSSTLQNQIADYNKLILERNRLVKVAGENNPNLKTLTEELKNIRLAIIDNIRRVKQENNTLLTETKSKNSLYMSKLGSTPRKERQLTDIKRQQNIKEGLYLFLLQKQEETGISMVGATSDARIIDRPIVGEVPVGMSKSIVYLIALAVGGFLAFVFVFIQFFMVNTLQSEGDIAEITDMPILAKIPFQKTKENLVIEPGNRTPIAEIFRLLRTNVQFLLSEVNQPTHQISYQPANQLTNQPAYQPIKGQAILVSSSVCGEGKSFVTLNLGMSLAIANKRTVIIVLDLRSPKPTDYSFLSKDTAGITNYLASGLEPIDIIQPSSDHRNLFFIRSGTVPDDPSELIMDTKMGKLFTFLKENFDYIIIDTSPVGLVSDALLLKPYIDMTLIVSRYDYTKKAQLAVVNEFYKDNKLKNPAIVWNGIKSDIKQSGSGFDYGYFSKKTAGKILPKNISNAFSNNVL
jgi:capsular exopolysaccharide synthesis family protein